MNRYRIITWVLVCFVAFIATGCTMLTVPASSIYEKLSSKQEPPIINILCLWQPGEGRDGDGLPTRGFVGQIFFFGAGSKKPVEIHGDVNIYVFDDYDVKNDEGKPLHIFNFEGGAWQNYQTTSNIGLAYQVFIPYTRKGIHQAQCTLRIKYTTPEGQPVFSDAANVVLSGMARKVNETTQNAKTSRPIQKQSPIIPTHYEVEQPLQSDPFNSKLSALQALLNEQKQNGLSQRDKQDASKLKSFLLSNKNTQLMNEKRVHNATTHPLLQKNSSPLIASKKNKAQMDKVFTDSRKHPLLPSQDSRHSQKKLKVYSIPLNR